MIFDLGFTSLIWVFFLLQLKQYNKTPTTSVFYSVHINAYICMHRESSGTIHFKVVGGFISREMGLL